MPGIFHLRRESQRIDPLFARQAAVLLDFRNPAITATMVRSKAHRHIVFGNGVHVNRNYWFVARYAALACGLILAACGQAPVKSGGNPNPVASMKNEPKELPIPAQYKDSAQQEFMLGGLLKTYDDVAWIGTDAVLAAGYKPNSKYSPTYVVEPTTDDLNGVYQFAFIENRDGKLNVGAIAQIDHHVPGMGRVTGVRVMDSPVEPSDEDKGLYHAAKAAESAPGLLLCKATYNHVILPYGLGGNKLEYRVYLLMSTTQKGVVPMGGHVLVRVADDGKTVLQVQPLAKSCMTGEISDDPDLVSIGISDLALDSPSAAHVFLMWRYEKPIYMTTRNGLLWGIDSRGIRLLGEGNVALDQSRVASGDIPAWLLMTASGASTKPSQLGCTTNGQCDIDLSGVPQGNQMIMVNHLRVVQPEGSASAAVSLRARAIALSPEVPHAGDWRPLASNMISAVLTPNGAHYVFEGSAANPRVRYLAGGDENLAKYVVAHWNKDMTNDDIVHMLETYLSGPGN